MTCCCLVKSSNFCWMDILLEVFTGGDFFLEFLSQKQSLLEVTFSDDDEVFEQRFEV